MNDLTVYPACPADFEAALQILFQHVPPGHRPATIAQVKKLLQQGELKDSGLLVAWQATELAGAILTVVAPGAVGLIWPPQAAARASRQAVEDKLVTAARRWLKDRGVKVSQALIPHSEAPSGLALERNDFPRVTSLSFLRRLCEPPHLCLPAVKGEIQRGSTRQKSLRFEPYGPSIQDCFARTLLETYESTQDCPELNGARSIEEVLAGHRGQGEFDPNSWWLASAGGEPIGVLLVNRISEWNSLEIIYMGVVPAARRQGFGRRLVLRALREAERTKVQWLTVTVDDRNDIARKLYTRLGFQPWDRRDVYLAIL